jgi:NAD(P)-dependent dehydrogenase (short-subunit alcohol dehydrogenase family)
VTPLSQQTILITGATDGLGRHLAEHLARSGARLLLHGRDAARGAETLRAIRAATGNERLEFVQADFASLAEVHTLAAKLASELERLDAIVNNAGITVNCLHPSSLMPTKMVMESYGRAMSTIAQGVEATARLVTDPALDAVSGRYFDVLREAKADPQAYDAVARRALRAATERLAGAQSV